MDQPEYMQLKIDDVPAEIITKYKLRELVDDNNCLYIEVTKGMYGLPQADIPAQQQLKKRLNQHAYHQSSIIPDFWTHESRPISFPLVVHDFGVKCIGQEHTQHLLNVLKQHNKVKNDWTGSEYIGLTIDWDYKHKKVHISMPKYATKAFKWLLHPNPTKLQGSPYQHTLPQYGAKVQYAATPDNAPLLDGKGKKYLQTIASTFLYYGRAVDPMILVAINALATEQSKPTAKTMERVKQCLDYCATQEEAIITYHPSDMILAVHSDARYLNETATSSQVSGHCFLSNYTDVPPTMAPFLQLQGCVRLVGKAWHLITKYSQIQLVRAKQYRWNWVLNLEQNLLISFAQ